MFDDNNLTLIIATAAGLAGSIITVVITKAIDAFSLRTEFKRNLQSKFFDRKLEVAEIMIRQLELSISNLNQILVLFRNASEIKSLQDAKDFDRKISDLSKEFELSKDLYRQKGDLLQLYFNIDPYIFNDTDTIESIGKLQEEYFLALKNKESKFFSNKLKEIESYYGKANEENRSVIELIKKEFVRYKI